MLLEDKRKFAEEQGYEILKSVIGFHRVSFKNTILPTLHVTQEEAILAAYEEAIK